MKALSRRTTGLMAGAIAALVVIAAAVVLLRGEPTTHLTVQFTDTTGLYVGNDVQIIGVTVGKVDGIHPHGTGVNVDIEVKANVPIARTAGAVIMQGSLVTDRFVELTPAYTKGPVLKDGGTIRVENTRSPANTDDIMSSLDDLLIALKGTTKDGRSIGDLLDVGSKQLDGKGQQIADALSATSQAMSTLDGHEEDLTAITNNLDSLVGLLATRDKTLDQLVTNVTTSTSALASQRTELDKTLNSLVQLSATTTTFVQDNKTLIGSNLAQAAKTLQIAVDNKAGLAEAFDLNPLVAENLWRTYDPVTKRTRIRVITQETGPFSNVLRADFCKAFLGTSCDAITNTDGTGLLDPLLDWPATLIPRRF